MRVLTWLGLQIPNLPKRVGKGDERSVPPIDVRRRPMNHLWHRQPKVSKHGSGHGRGKVGDLDDPRREPAKGSLKRIGTPTSANLDRKTGAGLKLQHQTPGHFKGPPSIDEPPNRQHMILRKTGLLWGHEGTTRLIHRPGKQSAGQEAVRLGQSVDIERIDLKRLEDSGLKGEASMFDVIAEQSANEIRSRHGRIFDRLTPGCYLEVQSYGPTPKKPPRRLRASPR